MRSSRGSRHRCGGLATLLVAALSLGSGAASAVSPGQSDGFSGGSLDGWGSGAASPSPPIVVAAGGPGGAADSFLQLSSTGVQGPGGKLVGIAGPQWSGNYLAAGVTGVSMWLQNAGATDLSLRLWLLSPGGSSVTSTPVLLPAGSGWLPASFSLLPGALTGQGASTLSDVIELRLFHGSGAAFPGANIAAQLGVDNVSAVPEPAGAVLMLAGLAGLVAHRRLRRRLAG
ncbi:MAG: VPLPA-CTERM sorting domain-containing protein [Aquabacterium sp.]|nr:VPLPA-CTERM sorting domain-containing protein [Aquabacterium sp.]